MNRLSREVSSNPLLNVISQWVTEILGRFHIHSSFEMDRTSMLGSSNCSCQGNRSTYHTSHKHHHFLSPFKLKIALQLLSPLTVSPSPLLHHHLIPLEITLQLHPHHLAPVAVRLRLQYSKCCLNLRICLYLGTPSKFPWFSETSREDFFRTSYCITSLTLALFLIQVVILIIFFLV
jgi:hypothetical protein